MNPVYCRQLEDKSGYGVFQGIIRHSKAHGPVLDEKWELCLGVGKTARAAWKDYEQTN